MQPTEPKTDHNNNRNNSKSCCTAGLPSAQSSRNRHISSFQRSQPDGRHARRAGEAECAMQ